MMFRQDFLIGATSLGFGGLRDFGLLLVLRVWSPKGPFWLSLHKDVEGLSAGLSRRVMVNVFFLRDQ